MILGLCIHERLDCDICAPRESPIPPNCTLVNGHLVCENDEGLFDLFTAGEGWWAFNLTKKNALITANAVSPRV
jgi:hypothetical protein